MHQGNAGRQVRAGGERIGKGSNEESVQEIPGPSWNWEKTIGISSNVVHARLNCDHSFISSSILFLQKILFLKKKKKKKKRDKSARSKFKTSRS